MVHTGRDKQFLEKGVTNVVKGISRRVIVVRSPDPRFFEQAIFLMKEDPFHNGDVSADQVVAEARRVAAGYLKRNTAKGRFWQRLPNAVWFLLGGGAIGVAWALSLLLG